MADLDEELLERVARWCADAGRQTGVAEIRAALAPLGWDQVLAVRALLADPPPARPLGPHALVDLVRGVPADVAAEREREGRYRREEGWDVPQAAAAEAPPTPAPEPRRKIAARRRAPEIVVRRARDRVTAAPEPPPPPPLLDELRLPAGRAVLERLIREHGGRRAVIARALAAGWRRADGVEVGEDDVAALLDLHGLARPFARRERDELLHALRAAGGVRTRAAERVGLDPSGLDAALARVGAEREAERIRGERRAELRARVTLSDRVHLVLEDPERLEDLGVLGELEQDLRVRLPEHVRALRAGTAPLAAALGASLSLDGPTTALLAARFGLELGASAGRERPWRSGGSRPAGGRRDGRAGPRDARAGGRDGGARGSRAVGPRANRPGSRDTKPPPRDVRAGPRDVRAGPRDVRAGPRDVRAGPRDVRAGPRDVRAGPRDVRAGPRDVRTGPRDTGAGPRGARRPDRAGPGGPRGGDRPAFSRTRTRGAGSTGRPPSTPGAPGASPPGNAGTRAGGERGPSAPRGPVGRGGGRSRPGGRGPRRP